MNGRRRFAGVIAATMLAAAMLAGSASATPGAITCTVAAILTLPNPENLLYVTDGSGTVAATYVCEGGTTSGQSLAGVSLSGGGDFSFCSHNTHSCGGDPSPDAVGEVLADAAASLGIPVGHTVSSLISFTMNTGVNCTHGLNGHNYVTVAHIVATNFTCKSGSGQTIFGPVNSTINDRVAEVLINPLLDCPAHPATGLKACFQQITYQGQLVALSAN